MYGSALNQRGSSAGMYENAVKADCAPSPPMLVEIGARMSGLVDRIRGAGNVLERVNSELDGSLPTDGCNTASAPSPSGALPQILEMLSDAHSLMDVLESEAQRLSSITGG